MNEFYNIFILVYKISLRFVSLFNNKAKEIIKNQKDLIKKIETSTKGEKNIVWFHAASLGEFEQGKSIIKIYKKKNPNHKILLSFYSPSGYNNIKKSDLINWIFYLPHDTKKNAKIIAKNIKPLKVIFINQEFWFNYIEEFSKENIPIYFISSIFQKEQYFFKSYGKWFARKLQNANYFFVQNTESKQLLKSINNHNVKVVGNSRIESVLDNSKQKYSNKIIQEFCKKKKVIIAGSSYMSDWHLLKKLDYNIIIAPHELNHLDKLKTINNAILLSNCKISDCKNCSILIIDEIGILSKIYRYADIAYIGGGFEKGIHNCLEAAVYNIPVIFGPKYHKFQEARDLISMGVAKSINNSDDLKNAIKNFEEKDIKKISSAYFNNQLGSSEIITQLI